MIRDRNYTLNLLRNNVNNDSNLYYKEQVSELENTITSLQYHIESMDEELKEMLFDNSELGDIVETLQYQLETMYDEIEKILLEGEDTEIGRKVTIERLKEYINKEK